jgi:hypothetical protein
VFGFDGSGSVSAFGDDELELDADGPVQSNISNDVSGEW